MGWICVDFLEHPCGLSADPTQTISLGWKMTLPPPYVPEPDPTPDYRNRKSKPKRQSWGGWSCLGIVAWLTVASIVHNQLWGTTDIPEDGFILFLIIDSVAAAAAVAAIALPIALVVWLWRKLTK